MMPYFLGATSLWAILRVVNFFLIRRQVAKLQQNRAIILEDHGEEAARLPYQVQITVLGLVGFYAAYVFMSDFWFFQFLCGLVVTLEAVSLAHVLNGLFMPQNEAYVSGQIKLSKKYVLFSGALQTAGIGSVLLIVQCLAQSPALWGAIVASFAVAYSAYRSAVQIKIAQP